MRRFRLGAGMGNRRLKVNTIRAAIYCRISSDPTGIAAGVERQENDCRAFCGSAGWEVAEVYVDNDISAYSGKPRPAYRRMMSDIEEGKVTALVAWHLDRLHRRPRELEDFIETCERAGLTRIKTLHGDVDLTTSSGRLHARIMGSVARHSSEHASERIRRKLRAVAEEGKPHGGGVRPYGFEPDRLTVREDEAIVIREMVDRLIGGESLRSLIADLNARAVPTVKGTRWTHRSVTDLVLSPRIAGMRVHQGQVIGPANWPAIIDESAHELVKATLKARAPEKRGRPHSYLLTGGVARCGRCGSPLMAKGHRRYVCSRDAGGCGRVAVIADPLEDRVREYVLDMLAGEYPIPAPEAASTPPSDLAAKLAGYRERLDRLSNDYAVEGLYDKATYLRLRADLNAKIEALQAELAPDEPGGASPEVWAFLETDDLASAWEGLAIADRREIVRALIDSVVVKPIEPGKPRRFDPGRIVIYPVWAKDAGIEADQLSGLLKPLI